MDIAQLSKEIVVFLAPFLPLLLKAGSIAAEEVVEQFTKDTWQQAKVLWSKLRNKVLARETAQEAAQDVADAPGNEDALAALRLQLRKLLAEDETLAQEVSHLMQGEVVQKVLAEGHSVAVRDVRQVARRKGRVRQEVIARGAKVDIEGVDQEG